MMTVLDRLRRKFARWKAKSADAVPVDELRRLGAHPDTDAFFADDARQSTPTRDGMRPLVGVGGISLAAYRVGSATKALDALCAEFGFPEGEEFKWSPGRELWMHTHLVGPRRTAFFERVFAVLSAHEARVVVVVVDGQAQSATGASTPEEDAVRLLIERIEHLCTEHDSEAFIVADRPGGGRKQEDAFLAQCLEVLTAGTKYVLPRRIPHNPLSTPSHLSRLLQAADLVTGITVARVAGERVYSPPMFDLVLPLMYRDANRVGGYGLKLHPALRYLNLYHWVCGDTDFWRNNMGTPLPMRGYPYAADEWTA